MYESVETEKLQTRVRAPIMAHGSSHSSKKVSWMKSVRLKNWLSVGLVYEGYLWSTKGTTDCKEGFIK